MLSGLAGGGRDSKMAQRCVQNYATDLHRSYRMLPQAERAAGKRVHGGCNAAKSHLIGCRAKRLPMCGPLRRSFVLCSRSICYVGVCNGSPLLQYVPIHGKLQCMAELTSA